MTVEPNEVAGIAGIVDAIDVVNADTVDAAASVDVAGVTASGGHGIVLFAHGAREARWAEPFARLAVKLAAAHGDAGPVTLAFLERMTPDLRTAIAAQAARGCRAITVVPVFFGAGAHVRQNLPALVAHCRSAHPDVRIHCANAVGEDDGVLEAVVRYCVGVVNERVDEA